MVDGDLQVVAGLAARDTPGEPIQLAVSPVRHVGLHVEHDAGIGLDAHRIVRRQTQHEGEQALQAPVGTGADVHRVIAAGLEEGLVQGHALTPRRLVRLDLLHAGLEAAEDAVGMQGAQIEAGDPGILQQAGGQLIAQARPRQVLRTLHEIPLVLVRGQGLEGVRDGRKAPPYPRLVGIEAPVELPIHQGVLATLIRA